MKAELKSLDCPDVDLETFVPEDPRSFGLLLQAMIGPEGGKFAESFDLQLHTPQWLLERRERGLLPPVVFGRHMLLVFAYDYRQIFDTIQDYCRSCVGADWEEVAQKLSRIGYWEFEDYQDNPS
jgi:hypothetical protein